MNLQLERIYWLELSLILVSGIVVAQGISIDLGKTEQGRYIKLVGNTGDGDVARNIKIGSEYCIKNLGTSMYFDVADDYFSKLQGGMYVSVYVEYYDTLNTNINLVYDARENHSGKMHSDTIKTTGTGKWKSASFLVNDAYFDNGLTNGADFKITSNGAMFINAINVAPFEKYINYGDGPCTGTVVNDSDDVVGISHTFYQGGDSHTRYEFIGGQMVIGTNAASQYLYCNIDDEYICFGNHPNVFVSVEYYDPSPADVYPYDPAKNFRLQYDATSLIFKSTSRMYQKGWGCFRTYTVEIADAFFANRMSAPADFRLSLSSKDMFINRISIAILPKKPLPSTTTTPNQTAFKALEPPTLDGNLTEWSWLNPYILQPLFSSTDSSRTDEFYRTWLLNNANVPLVEPGEAGGVTDPGVPGLWDTKDLMGWYRMQWDENNLYFSIVVKDNVVDVAGADWSEKDGFGFYLDVSHTYSGTPQAPVAIKDDDTFRQGESFIFFPATMSELAVWRHSTNPTGEVLTSGSGIQKSVVLTDSGYIIEASVPISLLKDGLTWNPGAVGDKDNFSPLFAYMLNDADNVGASSGRLMYAGYNDDDESWGNLSLQPLQLVDGGIMADLGVVNYENFMTQVEESSADGAVSNLQVMSKNCVKASGGYVYFDVSDTVISNEKPHKRLLISLEYLDTVQVPGDQFRVQYNSQTADYQDSRWVALGNTNTWKTAIFEIPDAKFAGRQNGKADFRVQSRNNNLILNQVRVVIADLWHNLADTTGYGFIDAYPGSDGVRLGVDNIGGYRCQTNAPGAGYMYFRVVDSLINGWWGPEKTHNEVFLTVEYYDTTSTNTIALQYDGVTSWFSSGVGNAFILGTSQWKLHTFYLPDAYFANRISGGMCDFRIDFQGSKSAYVHRIFIGSLDALLPVVGVEDAATIPYVFDLAKNYPNPFNPTTTIRYSLPKVGLTTLKIYNVLGQNIATLVNTVQQAGNNYSVQWNASNYSTGVYFCRLTQNDNVKVQKFILMK